MFAPLTDKVKQKSASSRTLTHGMKRLKKIRNVPRFHPNCTPLRATRCAVTGAPGRGSPLRSAVVELRHMTGCLQRPCGATLSASWRRELSLSASSLLQDETTLIVARPAEKIKGLMQEKRFFSAGLLFYAKSPLLCAQSGAFDLVAIRDFGSELYSTSCRAAKSSSPVRILTTRVTL